MKSNHSDAEVDRQQCDGFQKVLIYLNSEGLFLNIDVVLSPDNDLEDWYLSLWKDWIDANVRGSKKPSLLFR